jgi:hypothetical protein
VAIDFRPQSLQQQIASYQADVQRLGDDLAGIRKSMSWRMTAPLRALGRLVPKAQKSV